MNKVFPRKNRYEWPQYRCVKCYENTAYASGGRTDEPNKTIMRCDDCDYEWDEIVVDNMLYLHHSK